MSVELKHKMRCEACGKVTKAAHAEIDASGTTSFKWRMLDLIAKEGTCRCPTPEAPNA